MVTSHSVGAEEAELEPGPSTDRLEPDRILWLRELADVELLSLYLLCVEGG